MAFDKKFLLATTVIAGFAMAAPSLATAQTAQPASQEEDETAEVESVVVTGSRIRRNEFTSSAPIQVITAEDAELRGVIDTAELLQDAPIASGSNQFDNQWTGYITTGGAGTNTLSLRGLGANRTLVLLNGRRAGPAGVSGSVGPFDLNVVPQSIIDRVEILTDGASSVYGSDAVAGVVNIITRTNLDGGEVTAYYNQPFESGGESFRINGSYGRTFDRGYFNINAEWYQFEGLRRGDRDYTSCVTDYIFDMNTMENISRIDPNTGEALCVNIGGSGHSVINIAANNAGGAFPGGGANTLRVAYLNPSLYTYPTAAQGNSTSHPLHDTYLGAGWQNVFARIDRSSYPLTWGYGTKTHPFSDGQTTLYPARRYTIYSSGAFDLTPNIELTGEFLWNRRLTSGSSFTNLAPADLNSIGQSSSGLVASNPNNINPVTGVSFGTRVTPVIPRVNNSEQQVDYIRTVLGANGDFGQGLPFLSNWSWDAYLQYSLSDASYTSTVVYADRLAALSQPGVACGVSPFGNVSGFNCADLPGGIPWTSQRVVEGNFNQAEIDFLFATATGTTTYEQIAFEASVFGDLFSLPAGPVGAAFGVHARRDEIDDTPDPMAQARNLAQFTTSLPTRGQDTVQEVFGEIEVPVLRGYRFVDDLTLNVSARWSDYESYGSNSTYKVGLNWQITPAWRIRATQGTSFRAPSLFEQYLGGQLGFLAQGGIDPCIEYETDTDAILQANCAAGRDVNSDGDYNDPGDLRPVPTGYLGHPLSAANYTAGGAAIGLSAETSTAETLGVVWTPSFIDLSIAATYFDIEVNDQVASFGASAIISECYSSPTFPNDPFCDLIERNASDGTTRITTIYNAYTNINSQTQRGLDLTTRYGHDFSFGQLTLTGQFTWTFEDVVQLVAEGAADDVNGIVGDPDFTGTLGVQFDRGDWTVNWSANLIGKASYTEYFGGDTFYVANGADIPNGYYDLLQAGIGYVETYRKQYTEFTAYHSASVRYTADNYVFTVGVQNVFDEAPPNHTSFGIASSAGNTPIGGYDLLGRRAFFQVTRRF